MVTEATFPPYEFREGDEIVGIDPSIMREVSRATGRELIIEDMSFDSVITAVVTGKADVAASGITVTPERMQQVDFSIPYVEASQVIIVPKDSPVTGKDQIKGRRIGVQHGATGDIFVTRNIQQPERFPNGALAVAALAAGEPQLVIVAHGGTQMAALERFAVPHKNYYSWCAPAAGGFVLDAADWIHQKTLRVVKTVQYTKELPC